MINIKLHYEPPFNKLAGKSNEVVSVEDNITLNQLFEILYERHGEEFKELLWDKKNPDDLSDFLSIIINGRSFRDEKFLDKVLEDEDDISFLYVYFGG
ncbi:MAG: MoaD/ThiS family protein [Promethearchaeia archaeon]